MAYRNQSREQESTLIIQNSIRMVKQWILLALPILVMSSCSSQCYTCVNPNSTPEQSLCLSCKADYFLFNQTCLNCDDCSVYNSCGNCIPVGDNDGDGDNEGDERDEGDEGGSNKTILIIVFASLGGLAAIVIIFCLVRKYCRQKNLAQNDRIIELKRDENLSDQIIQDKEINVKSKNQKYWVNSREAIKLDNCSICLDPSAGGVIAKLKCGHTYHLNCISNWSKKDQNCPLCKSKDVEPIQSFCQSCNKYYAQIKMNEAKSILSIPKNSICTSCSL